MDLLGDPNRLFEVYGLLAIAIVMFLKEAGVPIPLPGDVLVIVAGNKAAAGTFGLAELIIALTAAAFIGSLLQYALARGPARRLFYRYGRAIGLPSERLDRLSGTLGRRGWIGVSAGRIAPGVRTIIVTACGLAAMPLRTFIPGILIGSAAFFAGHALLGFFFGPAVIAFAQQLNVPLAPLLAAFVLIGVLIWLVRHRGRAATPLARAAAWADAGCPICALASTVERFDASAAPRRAVHHRGSNGPAQG